MEEAKEETGNDHHQLEKRFSSLLIQPNSNVVDDDEEVASQNKETNRLNVLAAADQMRQRSNNNLNIQYDDQMVLKTKEALDENLPKENQNNTFFDKEEFWKSDEHNFMLSNMVFHKRRDQPLYAMEPVAFNSNEVKEDGEELRKLEDEKKDLKSTEMGRELSLIQQQQQQQDQIEESKNNEQGTGALNPKGGKSLFIKVNELIRPSFSQPSLSLIVKVVDCKLISSGESGQIPIAECLVGDETGMVVFTANLNRHVDMFMNLKPGTTLILHNAHVQVYNERMRLCVNESKGGHVEVCTEPAPFSVNEDINCSLMEWEEAKEDICREELRKLEDEKKDLKSTEMGRELSLIQQQQQQQQQQDQIEESKNNEQGTGALNPKGGKSMVKKVNELRPWFPLPSLSLIVKVVDCKLISSSGGYGPQIPIAECLVGDETAMVVFTAKLQRQVGFFMSLKPGTTLSLHNAHVQVYRGSMRLCVDESKGGSVVRAAEPAPFSVNEDNNLSLIELVKVPIDPNDA